MLTNASATMSSSNHQGIATQRTRGLPRELESCGGPHSHDALHRVNEMESSAERSKLIIRALRAFYFVIGTFDSVTILPLLSAIPARFGAKIAQELLAMG